MDNNTRINFVKHPPKAKNSLPGKIRTWRKLFFGELFAVYKHKSNALAAVGPG